MGGNLLDVLIEQYLRQSKNTPSLRGQLHETPPGAVTTASTGNTLPSTLGVSFIPLENKIGARAMNVASPDTILWAKNTTYILGRITAEDQDALVQKYQKFKSMIVSPRAIIPGMFYTFQYQAKTTPVYDRFPLVLPLMKDADGILGMNFHYLPPKMRFALFESMMPLIAPLPVSQLSLIRMTYARLMRRRFIGKLPTIKRYSFQQIRGSVIFISPLEWAVALAYPSEQFVGSSVASVWARSRTIQSPR